jgi:hypothetical protein
LTLRAAHHREEIKALCLKVSAAEGDDRAVHQH